MTNPIQLTKALIQRRSVTPEDAGCFEIIRERLVPLGFEIEFWEEEGAKNLWARKGNAAPLFCFAGHTDVVPPGPEAQWTSPPFEPTERDGKLFGRGAADMKSSIAAMCCAIETFIEKHGNFSGSLGVLLTSDEEGPALHGTKSAVSILKERGIQIEYCLVGEPTSVKTLGDTIKVGRRGSLSGTLTLRGTQGHVAYPDLADNATSKLPAAIQALEALEWADGNTHFQDSKLVISNVHAGTGATNVIPSEARIQFNIRHSPDTTVDQLKAQIVDALFAEDAPYTLDWAVPSTPYYTKPGKLFSAFAEALDKICQLIPEASTSGGTSDGRFIAEIADEVVELGPINASIHQIDEHIELEDIETLTNVYLSTLKTLLA